MVKVSQELYNVLLYIAGVYEENLPIDWTNEVFVALSASKGHAGTNRYVKLPSDSVRELNSTTSRRCHLKGHFKEWNLHFTDGVLMAAITDKVTKQTYEKRVVPAPEACDLVLDEHERKGHIGINRTFQKLNKLYLGVTRDMVEEVLSECPECALRKVNKPESQLAEIKKRLRQSKQKLKRQANLSPTRRDTQKQSVNATSQSNLPAKNTNPCEGQSDSAAAFLTQEFAEQQIASGELDVILDNQTTTGEHTDSLITLPLHPEEIQTYTTLPVDHVYTSSTPVRPLAAFSESTNFNLEGVSGKEKATRKRLYQERLSRNDSETDSCSEAEVDIPTKIRRPYCAEDLTSKVQHLEDLLEQREKELAQLKKGLSSNVIYLQMGDSSEPTPSTSKKAAGSHSSQQAKVITLYPNDGQAGTPPGATQTATQHKLTSVLRKNLNTQARLSTATTSTLASSVRHCHTTQGKAVKVQCSAPDFKGPAVVDGQFKDIKLSDYHGKYLILLFYPLDFTFVCPTEITAFSDRMQEFQKLNTEIIGISTDSHFSHLAWINTPRKKGGLGGIHFPLLSDFQKTISRNYGVLIDGAGIALRGMFIIDPRGILRQMTVNDLPVGRSVDETLRLIQAFQFTDKHGEVCPANWTPDRPTIKPDPQQSKEYFSQIN